LGRIRALNARGNWEVEKGSSWVAGEKGKKKKK